ncbi:hypothetical protein BC831DRAFT_466195 [Entophlyctis helioformis]|nr:hypothetical protein BC831DRAFT_466195 [Entophlyctis helioformis]
MRAKHRGAALRRTVLWTLLAALLSLFVAIPANAQRGAAPGAQVSQSTTFSFTVQPVGFTAPGPVVAATTASITLRWTTDTCAGATDGRGNAVNSGTPRRINGQCFDSNNRNIIIDDTRTFPQGLSALSLRRGIGSNSPEQYDLLKSVTNSPALAGVARTITITNLNQYPSDYYSLYVAATDSRGNLIQGQSPFFAIRNVEELPRIGSMQLWSPLDGSYWLANAEYRVRWELLPLATVPDYFNVDLLTADGQFIARLLETVPPNTGDVLLGESRPLNYTIWSIDPALRNKRFKLFVTGVFVVGGVVQPITEANPQVTSGVFFVGPVKPKTSAAFGSSKQMVPVSAAALAILLSLATAFL